MSPKKADLGSKRIIRIEPNTWVQELSAFSTGTYIYQMFRISAQAKS